MATTSKPKKPESQMTQLEKAQLAAERVRERQRENQGMKKDETKKPSDKPKPATKSPNAAAVKTPKPAKRPSYLDSMSPEEQIEEMRRMAKEDKAYDDARRIVPEGYKKGGMVTARGQGKAMRTRKTRIC